MNASGREIDVAALQRRAEDAIRGQRPRAVIVDLLEEIVAHAREGSEACRFAHRQLAELRLEEAPWSAALHLRRVLAATPDDDAAHALMGLCQALQGNYRAAVASFRKALAVTPNNPWYHHNLGHILDVALDAPAEAVYHLRKAHRADPNQEEVGASLAHCLGRIGACEEGLFLTRALLRRHPGHGDLRKLLAWLEEGAPSRTKAAGPDGRRAPPTLRAVTPSNPPPPAPTPAPATDDLAALARMLRRAGATDDEIARARRMWGDFSAATAAKMCESTAAAIDYAIARLDGEAAHQRVVARRHGVPSHALAARFRELKAALRLAPRDARYLQA